MNYLLGNFHMLPAETLRGPRLILFACGWLKKLMGLV